LFFDRRLSAFIGGPCFCVSWERTVANKNGPPMNADKRRSKFDSSTTGSSRSPSELRMLHLIKPLDGAAGTVKPFRVSLVEPVAYPKPSYPNPALHTAMRKISDRYFGFCATSRTILISLPV